jgi:hypothetical protein
MTEEETTEAETLPEPEAVAGTRVQDNVSTPGVQRLTHPDGSVQEHERGAESDEDDEPDDGVGDDAPDGDDDDDDDEGDDADGD